MIVFGSILEKFVHEAAVTIDRFLVIENLPTFRTHVLTCFSFRGDFALD
jgi:hypothetical protein